MKNKIFDCIPNSKYDPFYKFIFDVVPSVAEVDRWLSADKLLKIEQTQNTIKLITLLGGEEKSLYLSFPSVGGIRLSGEEKGYWNPESYFGIDEYANQDEKYAFKLFDGTEIKIFVGDPWAIKIINPNKKEVLSFGAENILYGFLGDEFKKIKLVLPIFTDEMMYGMGERFGGLNMVGKRTVFWNTDCGYHGVSENAELWRSYKNVPFMHSTRGYSLFYNSYRSALVDVGLTDPKQCIWEFEDSTLDVYIWALSPLENIASYTSLTGKPFLPPKWAFSYMAGGGNGFWNTHPNKALSGAEKRLAVMERVINGYSDMGTPNIASIYGEGEISYQTEAYAMLSKNSTRMMNWNPPDYEKNVMQEYLPDVAEADLPRTKDVNNPKEDCSNFIDFFNPNAKKLIISKYEKFWKLGLRGGMLDFAELVPENALFSNGLTGKDMHNFFPYWYGKTYGDACREVIGDDFVYYCRGGCAGSQHTSANFSGDQAATFTGLKQQLSSGLSMGCSGFSAWGADLGGYEMKPTDEVFIRGMQFATFQPLMRAHGTMTRCPWDFGENAIKTYKEHYWLRENLVNKLYSEAISASLTGHPMMRAFVLEYPYDNELSLIWDEYIFCGDFLVCPVFSEGAVSRKVVFPKGMWYDLISGKSVSGGQTIEVEAPIDRSPVYIKSGAVIPLILNDNLKLTASMLENSRWDVLLLTPPEKGNKSVIYNNKDSSNVFTYSLCENGFVLTSDSEYPSKALLVYGNTPSRVVIDGNEAAITMQSENVATVSNENNTLKRVEVFY